MIRANKKLYKPVTAGPWDGYVEVDAADTKEDPVQRWTGGKIPLAVVKEILSFFEWSMTETKSETMVHLFYHHPFDEDAPSRGWMPLVLPQRGYTGMSVKLIEDHPGIKEAMARLGGGERDTFVVSSFHHHCACSAFQSGTDYADEKTKEGLHVTIGGIGTGRYSYHARANFRNTMLGVRLSDWFEIDPAYAAVPERLHEQLLEIQLTTPPKTIAFPEWWKANVIKEESRIVPAWLDNAKQLVQRETFALTPEQPRRTPRGHASAARDIEDLARTWGMEMADIQKYLAGVDFEWACEFYNIMQDNGIDADELSNIVEDLLVKAAESEWAGLEDTR